MVATLAYVALTYAFQQSRVPTLDPTYGFPVPAIVKNGHAPTPTADWIWTDRVADNQIIYLRGTVKLSKVPTQASLFVTADNYFVAYVNGHQVGSSVHADGVDNWRTVRKFDVGQYLKPGKNVVAIQGENAAGQAGVLARLEEHDKPLLETGPAWKVSETASGDWTSTDFDDSAWSKPNDEGHANTSPWGGDLNGWPGLSEYQPPYLQHLALGPVNSETLGGVTTVLGGHAKPAVIQLRGPGEVTLDFGQELTGRVEIRANKPVSVEVGTGESYDEATEKPYRSAKLSLEAGRSEYSPYTAYRFAKLKFTDVPQGGVTLWVTCDHLYYPVAYQGSFECSEPLLNKVWYTGAYTAHLCMQEDIWDAPKRDRLRWMGDLHVSGEVINNVFLDKFLMEQTMERLRADAQGGAKADELPRGHVNGIPGYSAAWVAGLADFYRHAGDKDYLRAQAPYLASMIEFMKGDLNDDGVFANRHGAWAYTDWAPEFNGDHPLSRIATQLFFSYAAHEAAYLFHELGDDAEAEKCEAFRVRLIEAAQKHMKDDQGIFGDRRQANAMAIYSGAATAEQKAKIQKDILAPNAAAWNITATPYYNNYVLYAMKDSSEALQEIRRIWGAMVTEGATTFYEGYEPTWEKAHFHRHLQADDGTGYFVSLCHGWSAGPTNYLTERVLGVRSTGAGFKSFVIEPDLGGLRWVKGVVPTPHGGVAVSVETHGTDLGLNVEVPKETAGSLRVKGQVWSSKGGWHIVGQDQVSLEPGSYTLIVHPDSGAKFEPWLKAPKN